MKTPRLPVLRTRAGTGGFTLIELLVVISIIAILAGFALPVFTAAQKKGRISDSLNNCHQIVVALKMYSGDNDGAYPNTIASATPVATTGTPTPPATSNDALGNLMGKYTNSKKIFYNKASKWCPASAINVVETSTTMLTLQPGQCDWLYVLGLNDTSDSRFPLIATAGTATTPPTWTNATTAKGGVWGGTDVVIGYCDGSSTDVSGKSMNTQNPAATYPINPVDQTTNMFVPSTDQTNPWLYECTVLPPAGTN